MNTITAEEFSAEPAVADWRASDDGAAAYFATRNFAAGARLVAAIADLAEAANHHPDIELKYRGVTVRTVTHSAGGLTRKDVELARAISAAARDLGIEADTPRLASGGDPRSPATVLDLPFRGRWTTQNSPARRVPSHGTDLFGTAYAIDFVAVDARGRSAARSWRSILGTEPPGVFVGFGAPILSPVDGIVVAAHDGEPDHEARRSPLSQLGYALTQPERIRSGVAAIAGNHVVVALTPTGPFVLLAHLRQGSVQVRAGIPVQRGDRVGACGNSGNSTEPHVHVQVTETTEWATARGLPLVFRRPGGAGTWVPGESEMVDAG